jgi:ABC-2 type transport system permease protein
VTDVLAAEWIKLRTVRVTWWLVAGGFGGAALMCLLAFSAVAQWDRVPPARQAESYVSWLPPVAGWIAALCVAVLGILCVTGEYGSGLIRGTFVVMPRRRRVLTAKALLMAAVAAVVGGVTAGVTEVGVGAIIGDRVINGQPGPAENTVGALAVIALSVVMYGLLGLGLAALTRSAVASIVTLVMLWYGLPIILGNVPGRWAERVGAVLPAALADQVVTVGDAQSVYAHLLAPPVALAVMAAWALVPLGAAMVLVERRDA